MKRKHACVHALWYLIVGREEKKEKRERMDIQKAAFAI